jgi:hypothetical protein
MKTVAFVTFVLAALALPGALAGTGFDVSSLVSEADITCMMNAGYSAIIVRAWQSNGVNDPNVKSTLANAKSAGIGHQDVYMFPCPTCSASAATQFNDMVSNLGSLLYDKIWFDIEEDYAGQYWSTSTTTNRDFYANLVSACASSGLKCGVYSNYNNWVRIFGSSTYQASGGGKLPMWYADYDDEMNFDDYEAFGGWTPVMKQYNGDATYCGVSFDQNYFKSASDVWGSGSTGSSGTGVGTACTVSGEAGSCQLTSNCATAYGQSTSGYCPGAADVQCCTEVECTAGDAGSGICISTSQCSSDEGTSYAGYCPGAADIQCCVRNTCSSGGVAGHCMDTTSCKTFGGTSVAGLCPGPTDIQCCLRR